MEMEPLILGCDEAVTMGDALPLCDDAMLGDVETEEATDAVDTGDVVPEGVAHDEPLKQGLEDANNDMLPVPEGIDGNPESEAVVLPLITALAEVLTELVTEYDDADEREALGDAQDDSDASEGEGDSVDMGLGVAAAETLGESEPSALSVDAGDEEELAVHASDTLEVREACALREADTEGDSLADNDALPVDDSVARVERDKSSEDVGAADSVANVVEVPHQVPSVEALVLADDNTLPVPVKVPQFDVDGDTEGKGHGVALGVTRSDAVTTSDDDTLAEAATVSVALMLLCCTTDTDPLVDAVDERDASGEREDDTERDGNSDAEGLPDCDTVALTEGGEEMVTDVE